MWAGVLGASIFWVWGVCIHVSFAGAPAYAGVIGFLAFLLRLGGRGSGSGLRVALGGLRRFGPFQTAGGIVVCVHSRELGACAPRLLRFILLVSFSGTLLVVSILDIVYDMFAICGHFYSPEGVINSSCGNYGSFLTWG